MAKTISRQSIKRGDRIFDCGSQRYGTVLRVNARSAKLELERYPGEVPPGTPALITISLFTTLARRRADNY